ncbi:hypothetical protein T439DRAFT_197077 [Meredithblackwellia eburnea MCA 4105]
MVEESAWLHIDGMGYFDDCMALLVCASICTTTVTSPEPRSPRPDARCLLFRLNSPTLLRLPQAEGDLRLQIDERCFPFSLLFVSSSPLSQPLSARLSFSSARSTMSCRDSRLSRSQAGPPQGPSWRLAIALLVLLAVGRTQAALSLAGMNTIFSFGDSYTASGYTPVNGVKNITGIGQTSSDGLNWLQYLAASQPSTADNYYDFAVQGATTNNSIVDGVVPSFVEQVILWQSYFVATNDSAPVQVPWSSDTTLFVVWIGINDIGYSYALSRSFPTIQSGLFKSLEPSILNSYGTMDLFASNIAGYNQQLSNYVQSLAATPGLQAVLFDTQPFFNEIYNNFQKYGFQDGNSTCPDYETVNNEPNINLKTCPWPLAEYVFKDTYHVSWPVHKLLATVVVEFIANGTATIPTSTASITVQQTTLPPTTALPTTTAAPTATCPACTCPARSGAVSHFRKELFGWQSLYVACSMVLSVGFIL